MFIKIKIQVFINYSYDTVISNWTQRFSQFFSLIEISFYLHL